jgi:hypothetical protein
MRQQSSSPAQRRMAVWLLTGISVRARAAPLLS